MDERIENFYTKSIDDNDEYVDYLEISHVVKELRLYIDLPEMATGGCDENGEDIYEYYMHRTTFYALVDGMQRAGYKLIKTVYDRK